MVNGLVGKPHPVRWLSLSSLALFYLLFVLWRNLDQNHRLDERELIPRLGAGNTISLLRGILMAGFCGFLFSPWPEGKYAWLPGALYTAAALPDFLDGVAARLTDQVTKLGETLDVTVDGMAVLGVTILAVQYGQVPAWYLLVGFSRYLFLAGIWVRERLGYPILPMEFSVRRRGIAGLSMGFFFVVLYPVFKPPGTHLAAVVFGAYSLGSFLWDWLLVSGILSKGQEHRFEPIKEFAVRWLPVILRIAVVPLGILSIPRDLVGLVIAEIIVTAMLVAGVAGRVNAILALIIIGCAKPGCP